MSLFLGGLFIGAVGTAFVVHTPTQSSDWAAWAQALGAIGAIAAAFMISFTQRVNDQARERERDYRERIRILDGVVSVVDAAYDLIEDAPGAGARTTEDAIDEYLTRPSVYKDFQHVAVALQGIPVHTLPWWQIGKAVLEMQSHLAVCERYVQALGSDFSNRAWRHHLDELKQVYDSATASIEAVRTMEKALRRKE
ncbi:hypothetical protein [Paraburkholderia sediminicola]|uniref:hypothetical protein n=1 Tax=Paraburkholderia sediminicola TaxID=458836 RepID=UPI0038BD0670